MCDAYTRPKGVSEDQRPPPWISKRGNPAYLCSLVATLCLLFLLRNFHVVPFCFVATIIHCSSSLHMR